MTHRFFRLMVTCLLAWPLAASAAEPMTEAQAIALALSRPELERAQEAQLKVTRAQLEDQLKRPLPTLGLTHEQVLGDDRVASLTLSLVAQQQLDLSRWRERRRESQPDREAALKSGAQQRRVEITRAVRLAFYEAAHHQRRLEILDEELTALKRGVDVLSARVARDDASRYELLRLEREQTLLNAQRELWQLKQQEALGQLKQWTGGGSQPNAVKATLRPLMPVKPSQASEPSAPNIRQLDHMADALAKDRRVWGQPGLRGWTVGAGYRLASMGPVYGHGFILSLSAPLPLWSVDQARISELDAQRALIIQERSILSAQRQANLEDAYGRCERALKALERLELEDKAGQELERMATKAYEAGESSMSEWLEVRRRELGLRLTAHELAWEARRAAIELEYQRGQEVVR